MKKKLVLTRTALRSLDTGDLTRAAGGQLTPAQPSVVAYPTDPVPWLPSVVVGPRIR